MLLDLQMASANAASVPAEANFEVWLQAAASRLSLSDSDNTGICIRIVDEAEMREINSQFRHKDSATNVLSFPLLATLEDDSFWLGDVLICAAVVMQEAQQQGKPVKAHWAHMTVHGLLHLLDYDHETDDEAAQMESQEIAILNDLGFPNPYESQANGLKNPI